jgi:tRNA(Ile)-lysidine synthase
MHCLQELAKIDIQPCSTDQASVIKVSVLKSISQERLKNLLRFWINSQNIRVPSRKILQHIVTDIVLKEKIETSPVQIWKEGEIRRYQNKLYLMRPLTTHDPSQVFRWKIDQPLHIESINRTLTFNELKDSGVKLPSGVNELIVRFREGGERLKPIGQKQHRSLKKLLNEAAVPPWERSRIPLIYYQDQLIAVLGYWHAEPECETPV